MSKEIAPYVHTVPAGTRCHGLRGGMGDLRWVVDDLSWLPRSEFAYFDAEHHGIDIPADEIVPEPVPQAPGFR